MPPLVDAVVFATVQEQLKENRRHARQGLRGARSLTRPVCCVQCGYAFYGKPISPASVRSIPRYAYYRCLGTTRIDSGASGCATTTRSAPTCWTPLSGARPALFGQPNRLEQEYHQRLAPTDEHAADHTALELQRTKLRHGSPA